MQLEVYGSLGRGLHHQLRNRLLDSFISHSASPTRWFQLLFWRVRHHYRLPRVHIRWGKRGRLLSEVISRYAISSGQYNHHLLQNRGTRIFRNVSRTDPDKDISQSIIDRHKWLFWITEQHQYFDDEYNVALWDILWWRKQCSFFDDEYNIAPWVKL